MNRIAIFTSFGPWEDLRSLRQELWCHAWHRQNGVDIFVLDQGQEKTKEMCSRFGFHLVTGIKKASSIDLDSEGLLMDSIFQVLSKNLPKEVEIVSYSGDALMITPHVAEVYDFVNNISNGLFQAFIRARDLENWAHHCQPLHEMTLNQIGKKVYKKGKVHFPGADTFIWSRKVFDRLAKDSPPMDFLRGGSERFWWNWAFRQEDIHNYELTTEVKLVHLDHEPSPYRGSTDWEVDPDKSEDLNYKHMFKYIPRTLNEVWALVEADLHALDNGVSLVEWIRKEQKNGSSINSKKPQQSIQEVATSVKCKRSTENAEANLCK